MVFSSSSANRLHGADPLDILRRGLFLLLLAAIPVSAGASEIRLVTNNDLIGDRDQGDDLYTYSLGVELDSGPFVIRLSESAFTDRDADLRFDETRLSVGRQFDVWGEWVPSAEVGLLYVGRGLLGSGTQNAVHRLIGNQEVDLPYIDSRRLYPELGLRLHRPFYFGDRLVAGPYLEASTAPGFQSHLSIAGLVSLQVHPAFGVRALAGLRLGSTSFAPLESHIADQAPLAELELQIKERILLKWTYNEFGTRQEHVSLGYRLRLGSGAGSRR